MMPSSEPPMSSAMMTVTALTPDLPRHDLRHEEVILDLLLREKEDQHEQPGLRRHGERDRDRRNGGEDRSDDRNHLAERGDQRQHVEVRNTERVQTDRGADARSTPPRMSWPLSHALTFIEICSRGFLHARAIDARKEPREAAEQGVALDQQIEGENQDREKREDARRRRSVAAIATVPTASPGGRRAAHRFLAA